MSVGSAVVLALVALFLGYCSGRVKEAVRIRLLLRKLIRDQPLTSVQRVDWERLLRSGATE